MHTKSIAAMGSFQNSCLLGNRSQDLCEFASQCAPHSHPHMAAVRSPSHSLSSLRSPVFTPESCLHGRHSSAQIHLLAPLLVLILFPFHFRTFIPR